MRYLIAFLFAASMAFAQGGQIAGQALVGGGVPNARIRVCAFSASPSDPCTPTVAIYSDPDMANDHQISNPTSADAAGNYSLFTSPGKYTIQISGSGVRTFNLTYQVPVSLDSSGVVPSFMLLPLSNPSQWSTTGPGVRIDPSPGFTDNAIGTGQESRLITSKLQLPNSPSNIFYSSGVFESWIGNYLGGSLAGPAIVTLNATADRNLGTYTGQLFGLVSLCRDSSTTGLLGKGPIRCNEIDLVNNSTGDAIYGGVSSVSPATNSDWENNGEFISSVGSNKGGIGLRIGSNNPGAGNWVRGAVITDYDSSALSLIKNTGNGDALLTIDSVGTGQNTNINWNSNGSTKWVTGKNLNDDWGIFDGNAVQFRYLASQGTNADTSVNANGTGHVQINRIGTSSNCSSSASPAVCSSAAAGSVVIAAGATSVQVNTTAVTDNSQIFIQADASLGTKLGVTCNTTGALLLSAPWVSARTSATSFTITVNAAPSTNPECLSYFIVN